MTIRLRHVKDTEAAALYLWKDGCEMWIPRSVITSRTKFPQTDPLVYAIHELRLEDWWYEKWEADQHEKDNDS